MKLRELADIVKISKEHVGFILHEHLTMRKLCSKWVPRLLTVDQKRVDDSEQCLAMFKRNKPEFLRRYVTDLAPSDYWLFADLKKMLAGKKFRTNEEVIAETEAYFQAKDKSFYKSGIEMLERRWNDCVALDGDYVDE